jgi:hypothetical protein
MKFKKPYMSPYAAIILIFLSQVSRAEKYHGRFTLGGYAATERFSDTTGGSDKNDFMTLSSRYFLKVSEIGAAPWEVVTDIRDKHDFFDKLDREKLQLTDRNSFQVRQLSARYVNTGGILAANLGRFAVPEAGASGVDGAQLEERWSQQLTSSIFAGKNPKRNDQTYYQYNPDSNIGGVSLTYQDRVSSWDRNFYLSHAMVTEQEGSETDRRYFYHNMIYQWQENSRVISLMYLDFVPRTYVQTGNLIWQQQYTTNWTTQVSALGIDVIEYTRRQGVREQLAPSPYQEGAFKLDYYAPGRVKIELGASSGTRQVDSLSKTETYLGWEQNQIGAKNWDLFLKSGIRKNFVSDDTFGHLYLGYFSRKWESSLDLDVAIEKYNDGVTKHPISTELSISNYLSRQLFSTLSLQRSADEVVTIYTAFFKLGYRFGNQEIPPIRDGSPPRGQL